MENAHGAPEINKYVSKCINIIYKRALLPEKAESVASELKFCRVQRRMAQKLKRHRKICNCTPTITI